MICRSIDSPSLATVYWTCNTVKRHDQARGELGIPPHIPINSWMVTLGVVLCILSIFKKINTI